MQAGWRVVSSTRLEEGESLGCGCPQKVRVSMHIVSYACWAFPGAVPGSMLHTASRDEMLRWLTRRALCERGVARVGGPLRSGVARVGPAGR